MNIRHSIIITLLTLIPLWASAQELTVQSFTLSPTEIIPSNDQRKDLNGTACALVKVQVVDDIDRVEGNVIGSIIKRGTEKWVFVTDGTKELRLYPKSHLPLSVVCKEYGIESLDSKRVYILRLSSNQQAATSSDDTPKKDDSQTQVPVPVEEPAPTTQEPVTYDDQYTTYNDESYKNYPRSSYGSYNSISFGIRAGANIAWTQFGEGYDDVGMAPSFHVGISMDIPFSDNLYLNTALLYSGKGYKYDKVETASAQYIDLPIQLSIRFGDIDETQFQINAGPYAAMGIGGTIKSESGNKEQKFFEYYNGFDYGLVIGAGVIFSSHYYVGANFQLGFADYRNRNIGISLGYIF